MAAKTVVSLVVWSAVEMVELKVGRLVAAMVVRSVRISAVEMAAPKVDQ